MSVFEITSVNNTPPLIANMRTGFIISFYQASAEDGGILFCPCPSVLLSIRPSGAITKYH